MSSSVVLAARVLDQLLDAVALAYGFAHGAALAAGTDTLHALTLYALVLALTYAVVARLEPDTPAAAAPAPAPVKRRTELAAAAAQIVVIGQRYATYALACVLRLRAGTLFVHTTGFSVHALSVPLAVVLIAAAIVALVTHFKVAPRVGGMRAPVAMIERFVDGVAFSYGLGGAVRGRVLEAALWLAVVLLACAAARQRAATTTPAATFRAFALSVISFIEQYALYLVARLISASGLVHASMSTHGAPLSTLTRGALVDNAVLAAFVVLLVAGAALADALGAPRTPVAEPTPTPTVVACDAGWELARTGRGLVERFVDAVVVTAAFAHAAVFARALDVHGTLTALAAVLVAAYALETRARADDVVKRPLWRALAALAALASRYAVYAFVQTMLGRGLVINGLRGGTAAAPWALAAACALPITLVSLLVVVRRTLERTDAALVAAATAWPSASATATPLGHAVTVTASIACETLADWNE